MDVAEFVLSHVLASSASSARERAVVIRVCMWCVYNEMSVSVCLYTACMHLIYTIMIIHMCMYILRETERVDVWTVVDCIIASSLLFSLTFGMVLVSGVAVRVFVCTTVVVCV